MIHFRIYYDRMRIIARLITPNLEAILQIMAKRSVWFLYNLIGHWKVMRAGILHDCIPATKQRYVIIQSSWIFCAIQKLSRRVYIESTILSFFFFFFAEYFLRIICKDIFLISLAQGHKANMNCVHVTWTANFIISLKLYALY